jgi:transcriptional regulator with PAS, ATPase and Fis domain
MTDLLKKIKSSAFCVNVRKAIDCVNPFTISEKLQNITKQMEDYQQTRCKLVLDYEKLEKELQYVNNKRKEEQKLTTTVLDHLPDMLWAKDLDGKYILSNKAFREQFLYGLPWKEVKGKTDIELANLFKSRVGTDNHTFGELCASSDEIIMRTEEARKFLEHGLIDGKMLRLVVNKAPVYNLKGEFFATCGNGRNVTEWYDGLKSAIESSNACFGSEIKELFEKELNKYEFKIETKSN